MRRHGLVEVLVAGIAVAAGLALAGTANAYSPPTPSTKVDFWTPSGDIDCSKDGTTGVYCLVMAVRNRKWIVVSARMRRFTAQRNADGIADPCRGGNHDLDRDSVAVRRG